METRRAISAKFRATNRIGYFCLKSILRIIKGKKHFPETKNTLPKKESPLPKQRKPGTQRKHKSNRNHRKQ
jgi:hypothetical protein